jgi:helicase
MKNEELIRKLLEVSGFKELNPVQKEALKKGLLEGKNLVIFAPTASGKTFCAELAAMKTILEKKKKVVYMVPLVALANEKYREFKKKYSQLGIKVALSIGDLDSDDPFLKSYQLIVVSNEKMDSLIRHGADWINDIGLIVVDEIHLLDHAERGPTLEITLTLLRKLVPNAQILALSATIRNAKELAGWLDADTVISEWRPVKLYKGVSYPYRIKFLEKEGYELDKTLPLEASIVKNTLGLGKQALFFVSTRRGAESLAEKLGEVIVCQLSKNERRELEKLANEVESVLEVPTQQCKKIAKCIRLGSAFHHAGILYKQKSLIEENFRSGLIKVIVATPTLCLHPDTFVITLDSVKKVSDVKEGDLVITHEGKFEKVISTLENEFSGKLLSIKPYGSLEIKVTPGHRILVLKQIRHKSRFSDGSQKIWWEYEGPNWMKAREVYEAFKFNKDNKVSFMLLQPLPKPDVRCEKIILKKEESYIYNQYGKTNTYHPASDKTPKTLPLNLEISRLIGIWIAEGSTSKAGSILFDIASYEENLTNFITTTIKKYFPKSKVVIKDLERHRRRIRFCNKKFASWLRNNIGNDAHSKKIPMSLLLNKKREVRLGIFYGLLEGDGYVRVDNKNRTHYVSIITTSPTLAYQIQMLLLSLGYVSSISMGEKSEKSFGGKRKFFSVKIGGKSFYNLLNELRIDSGQKKGNRTYNINKIWNNYLLLKIKKIKEEEYSGRVYNLSVKKDKSYSVGFIVHNSYGVNLPSFRVVMKDLKRYYAGIGAIFVPILDVQQMLGRAGRPPYDSFGEGIILAKNEEEAEEIIDHYIYGEPEDIRSKLALEPVLRMHTLALIASEFCKSSKALLDFFSKTFYAFQFGDISLLEEKILNILEQLIEWKFVVFKKNKIEATRIGKRVSELYIDPLTAHQFIEALTKTREKKIHPFGLLQLISNTIEMRPLLSVRAGEFSELEDVLAKREEELLQEIPDESELEFDNFLRSLKTALMFEDWIEEATEDQILVKYRVAPGEFYGRREIADWLVYSLQELALLLGCKELLKHIRKLRVRLEYGVKEELIPLVRLKQVGRIRARRLFNAGIKSLADLRKASIERISAIVGPNVAKVIKDQLEGKEEKKKIEKQFTLKKY